MASDQISRRADLTFTPNLAKLSTMTRMVFDTMVAGTPSMETYLTIELVEYYVTAILWARLLDLRLKRGANKFNTKEAVYHSYFVDKRLNLPEPLYDMIRSLGTYTDRARSCDVYVADHWLPISEAGGKSGYHAPMITAENHNLFEEVPSLGVIGDAIMAVASTGRTRKPHFPFLPDGTLASRNLLGYVAERPSECEEVRQFLLSNNHVSEDAFAETVIGTRLNMNIVEYVLQRIHSPVYNTIEFVVTQEGSNGSMLQLVETFPVETNIPDLCPTWTEVDVRLRYLRLWPSDMVRLGIPAGFQLYKQCIAGSHANWCCLRVDETNGWSIPIEWIMNRNDRRKLPYDYVPFYKGEVANQVRETALLLEVYIYRRLHGT